MKKTIVKRLLSLTLVLLMVVAIVPSMTSKVEAASFTMLKQTDSKWSTYKYNGASLSSTGSGIFALANAIGFVNAEKTIQ